MSRWLNRLKSPENAQGENCQNCQNPPQGAKAEVLSVLSVPIPGAFEPLTAANEPTKPPSQARYWPNTQHANDTELNQMEARLMIFKRHGVDDAQADQLTDKLLIADRQQTGQVTCHLCQHFNPRRKTCGNFRSAGVGQEVGELAAMLQRCPGYATATQ